MVYSSNEGNCDACFNKNVKIFSEEAKDRNGVQW
jgi:hypothetical protein